MPYTSFVDLFEIGIGPSSSHAVGPMKAAHRFASELVARDLINDVAVVTVELFGSLGLTGLGHNTDGAVILGLSGFLPATIDPADIGSVVEAVRTSGSLRLAGDRIVSFDPLSDIVFHPDRCHAAHPNVLTFAARSVDEPLLTRSFASVGGGFVRDLETLHDHRPSHPVPYPFDTARQMLETCRTEGSTIARLAYENEAALHGDEAVCAHIDSVYAVMMESIERGLAARGSLPGGLDVERRARDLYVSLVEDTTVPSRIPGGERDWATAFAIAVSEENAAGGRIVTAPTNGAAGIIPAVLRYYRDFVRGADDMGIRRFIMSAAAIGSILTQNAGVSGAELGCQAEVGSACAMAAAGLAAAMGGTPGQVENAARRSQL